MKENLGAAYHQGIVHALCAHEAPEGFSAEELDEYERARQEELDRIDAADPTQPASIGGQRCPTDQSERY